jgi:hypothetical protein
MRGANIITGAIFAPSVSIFALAHSQYPAPPKRRDFGMTRRDLPKLLFAGGLFLLGGCGFKAGEPARSPPPETPAPPLSTIAATLSIPAADIARLLNDKTTSNIAELHDQPVKCGIGRCRLTLQAVRTGAISASTAPNGVSLIVPFAANAILSLPGIFSFVRAKANASGEAMATTTASIGRDWQILPRTQGVVELENSHLRVGPLVTNLADIWNANDELLSRPLFKLLDKKIAAGLHERARIQKFWARAFTPIKVAKRPIAWLLLQPERLRVGQPSFGNDQLTLSFGLDVRARVLVQDDPPQIQPTKLPAPAPMSDASNLFRFAVPLLFPFERASRLALESLERKPPRIAGAAVRFEKLEIIPSGQDVILAAQFCLDRDWDVFHWFSACGSGYLRGNPTFDAAARTIRVVNVHYDVATENLMLGAMRLLAGPSLGRDLEGRLKFPIAKELDRLEAQIATAIAKPEGRDISISGTVRSFGPPSLTWTKDGFLAMFSAQGSVHAVAHI